MDDSRLHSQRHVRLVVAGLPPSGPGSAIPKKVFDLKAHLEALCVGVSLSKPMGTYMDESMIPQNELTLYIGLRGSDPGVLVDLVRSEVVARPDRVNQRALLFHDSLKAVLGECGLGVLARFDADPELLQVPFQGNTELMEHVIRYVRLVKRDGKLPRGRPNHPASTRDLACLEVLQAQLARIG